MKKIKLYILTALMGLAVTSCKDFLTLMPLNEVVLENFWTNKADVESVLMGAYGSLESSDCLVRMSIWGEMRSDNIVGSSSNSDSDTGDDIIQITKDNILQTNSYTSYLCFYKVINYANTVLHFAPQVAEKDPNYTEAELKGNKAEAIALRALCYWYLIRAYKDVPYTTIPSIDDTHDFFIGQTGFDAILDSLITDLVYVRDLNWPINRYSKTEYNTTRFTRTSINAMLADMYLWKGEWQKCIDCCELVTERKYDEYVEKLRKEGKNCTVVLFDNKYPLITETPTGATCGNAYNETFGKGSSFEVLLELPFDDKKSNPFVSTYYNDENSKSKKLKAYSAICNGFGTGSGNSVFVQPYDVRYYQNVYGTDGGITKYVFEKMEYNMSDGQIADLKTFTTRKQSSPNWIIYRYTDVLLMEAEAKVMLANELGADTAVSSASGALLDEAFELVKVVNNRAICKSTYKDAKELKKEDYIGSIKTMEELVLAERRRELMFEGKRWFDLVRMARRDGNTDRLITKVVGKLDGSAQSAFQIKMLDMNAMYFPINKDELKINDKLVQNPVYVEDEYVEKAK